eukprot:scaffold4229_cov67-Phaeocystis_antarctica.AAC.3
MQPAHHPAPPDRPWQVCEGVRIPATRLRNRVRGQPIGFDLGRVHILGRLGTGHSEPPRQPRAHRGLQKEAHDEAG